MWIQSKLSPPICVCKCPFRSAQWSLWWFVVVLQFVWAPMRTTSSIFFHEYHYEVVTIVCMEMAWMNVTKHSLQEQLNIHFCLHQTKTFAHLWHDCINFIRENSEMWCKKKFNLCISLEWSTPMGLCVFHEYDWAFWCM